MVTKNPTQVFAITFILGCVLGLTVFGWWLWPVEWTDAAPENLSDFYKIQYTRLVAGSYAHNHDLALAQARLEGLGDPPTVLASAMDATGGVENQHLVQLQAGLAAAGGLAQASEEEEAPANPSTGSQLAGWAAMGALAILLTGGGVYIWRQPQVSSWFGRVWRVSKIRKQLLSTLLLLGVYRLAARVPLPGINLEAAKRAMEMSADVNEGVGGVVLSLDVLSGGTVSTFSVLSVGILGYMAAYPIVHLLANTVRPWRKRLEDDPREGEKAVERWVSHVAFFLSLPISWGLLKVYSGGFARCLGALANVPPVHAGTGNLLSTVTSIAALMAAAKFAEWVKDLIAENFSAHLGVTLIIFSGIVLRIWQGLGHLAAAQGRWLNLGVFGVTTIAVVFFAVYILQGRRNVPLMYPGRRVGSRMSMPVKGTLPLMVNMAGVTPLVFAYSLLVFPGVVAGPFLCVESAWVQALAARAIAFFAPANPWFWLLFFILIVAFTFFYTDVLFATQNYGENLKRAGAQIPGVSRGQNTQRYLTWVLRRTTIPGALFLGFIGVLPFLINTLVGAEIYFLSGIELLVLVAFARDLFYSLDTELKLQGYDDLSLMR